MGEDDIKALPKDGGPIVQFDNIDAAWLQVYEGIKAVVNRLRTSFVARQEFLEEMEHTDFISQGSIGLREIFVFLPLEYRGTKGTRPELPFEGITDPNSLLNEKYTIIHGMERSGKTALSRFMFLTLVEQSRPVLYIDLGEVPHKARPAQFRKAYESEFHGDFALWIAQQDKTLILDNLSSRSDLVDFLLHAKERFERIIVTLSSSVFHAYFRDESRLADFQELEIGDLDHALQEVLIRKRLSLIQTNSSLDDGFVDRVEDRVNSIVIGNKIVPRYPFFILCILQTYEAYMPSGLRITSYGHCYYALIVASLIRAGISAQDSDIDACFNFAEHLAFAIYHHEGSKEAFDLDEFIQGYRRDYVIADAVINRLRHEEFGLIDGTGQFRSVYMHYFFLGKFLSSDDPRKRPSNRKVILDMCSATHVESNFLTLLFTIHHTDDVEIIDDILLRSMYTLDGVQAASLDRTETRRFQDIVTELPKSILSMNSVEHERKRQRELKRDTILESPDEEEIDQQNGADVQEEVNGIYKILKNNDILGQVLRNKYGSIKKKTIEEVIEIMADGGLRLVNLILKDENEITEMANYIRAKNPEYSVQEIKRDLGIFSFIWTLMNVEGIVRCINVPEVRPSIQRVVERSATPAYDIIGYFTLLDTTESLGANERKELARLLKKHQDPFLRGVLSIRTQQYLNTHRTKAQIRQAICSMLGIKYVPRLL